MLCHSRYLFVLFFVIFCHHLCCGVFSLCSPVLTCEATQFLRLFQTTGRVKCITSCAAVFPWKSEQTAECLEEPVWQLSWRGYRLIHCCVAIMSVKRMAKWTLIYRKMSGYFFKSKQYEVIYVPVTDPVSSSAHGAVSKCESWWTPLHTNDYWH